MTKKGCKDFFLEEEIEQLNVYVIAKGEIYFTYFYFPETRIDPKEEEFEANKIEYESLDIYLLSSEEESPPIKDEAIIEKVKKYLLYNIFDYVDPY